MFVHELGHVFGMQHINEDDDSIVLNNPSNMWFDRTTIHGLKYQRNDHRGTVIQADSTNVLGERDEQNNDWHVNLCLYPASDTTCQDASVVCAQP